MTFDEETDATDPLVAERFQLLDQLAVPPAPTDGVRTLDANAMAATQSSNRRPTFALAAAAAVVVVAALSALAFTQRNSGQELVALESNQVDAGTADAAATASEPNGDAGSGDSSASTDATDSRADDQEPLVVEDDADASTTTSIVEGESGSANGGVSTSAATTTPPSSDVDSTTGSSLPDVTETTPVKTTPTETVATTAPPTTTSTTAPVTQDGSVTTIRGLLTVVFTDCQSRLVLNDSGEVENVGPVSCDGGSYIVVDGNRIQTSAGFVASDAYWDRHPSNFQPGQTVVVTAFAHANGRLDLSCSQCSVRWG